MSPGVGVYEMYTVPGARLGGRTLLEGAGLHGTAVPRLVRVFMVTSPPTRIDERVSERIQPVGIVLNSVLNG